jgi:C4-dicarboxylate transporter
LQRAFSFHDGAKLANNDRHAAAVMMVAPSSAATEALAAASDPAAESGIACEAPANVSAVRVANTNSGNLRMAILHARRRGLHLPLEAVSLN